MKDLYDIITGKEVNYEYNYVECQNCIADNCQECNIIEEN